MLITLEGLRVRAKTIPKNRLVSIWKTLTREPFPEVKAFRMEDEDFEYVLQIKKCTADERREMEEWGRVLSTRGTDACVFNAGENAEVDYVILIRENPYHDTRAILEHELRHIARGDL